MDAEQRYLFDLQGFLVVEDVLDEAELRSAREAADRYISGVFDGTPLPPGFYQGRKGNTVKGHSNLQHAFAFDRALEALCFHPKVWPIVCELTDGRPQLNGPGTMIVDDVERTGPRAIHAARGEPMPNAAPSAGWHCAGEGNGGREGGGSELARVEVRDGRIFSNNFVVFPYLDTVRPGDGGLVVLPGSHKSNFDRLQHLFPWKGHPHPPPAGAIHVTPKAGSFVIMPEATTHGVLPWTPADRQRRVLVLRYQPHELGQPSSFGGFSEEVMSRLAPETLELLAYAPLTTRKAIASQAVVRLSHGPRL